MRFIVLPVNEVLDTIYAKFFLLVVSVSSDLGLVYLRLLVDVTGYGLNSS
jgi:hypothetical protein